MGDAEGKESMQGRFGDGDMPGARKGNKFLSFLEWGGSLLGELVPMGPCLYMSRASQGEPIRWSRCKPSIRNLKRQAAFPFFG